MDLNGERSIQASIEKTWAALNDPAVLRQCIAGCESLERTADDTFSASLALKIGPVNAKFKGLVRISEQNPPNSYTLSFEGQGGMAGFGKGTAAVKLTSMGPAQTRLNYTANAKVGGKIAQVGSRLVDATAAKMADDFFKAFEVAVETPASELVEVVPPVPVTPSAPSFSRTWLGGLAVAVGLAALYFATR